MRWRISNHCLVLIADVNVRSWCEDKHTETFSGWGCYLRARTITLNPVWPNCSKRPVPWSCCWTPSPLMICFCSAVPSAPPSLYFNGWELWLPARGHTLGFVVYIGGKKSLAGMPAFASVMTWSCLCVCLCVWGGEDNLTELHGFPHCVRPVQREKKEGDVLFYLFLLYSSLSASFSAHHAESFIREF